MCHQYFIKGIFSYPVAQFIHTIFQTKTIVDVGDQIFVHFDVQHLSESFACWEKWIYFGTQKANLFKIVEVEFRGFENEKKLNSWLKFEFLVKIEIRG